MVKMRIPIREQLGALVLLASLIALAVVSVATWVTVHDFVLTLRASRLSLTASLKSAQLTSNIALMQSHVRSAASRIAIQLALQRYNNGNNTVANWARTQEDLAAVFQGGGQNALLLQAQIFAKNSTGPAGNQTVLVQSTGSDILGTIQLPGQYDNGSSIHLGDSDPAGYPSILYPNFTYWTENANGDNVPVTYQGQMMTESEQLLLGPWTINDTLTLLSITLPIINNTSSSDLLGWLTVILDGRLLEEVVSAAEGLDNSGLTMLLGPSSPTNKFPSGVLSESNNGSPPEDASIKFKLPPTKRPDSDARHPDHMWNTTESFSYSQFPAVKKGFTTSTSSLNNAGSLISTKNENGIKVSVGYARADVQIVDWILAVEQSHAEVWAPINHLRNILLACIFGTLGGMVLLVFPVAHYSSRPIRRLREATKKTMIPVGFDPNDAADETSSADLHASDVDAAEMAAKEGFFGALKRMTTKLNRDTPESNEETQRRAFRIPGKVKERKHFIHDELTDLTHTFNEMSDELMMQYEKLEERVAQRTAELELSKQAAEAANESKTLFIANISHELKTPLNGIMGMCAVCMSEDDPIKMKRSLGIIYKSGDLLLNLLTDLLTFSKHQVGQNLSLDEKEFRLRDVRSQILAIFERQAKESEIDFSFKFEGPVESNIDEGTGQVNDKRVFGPFGVGKIKDMVLWGDQHRILQVLINLVSNSLKFTPRGGKVVATVRCVGDSDVVFSRNDSSSRLNSGRNSRNRSRVGSSSQNSVGTPRLLDTANEINPLQKSSTYTQIMTTERAASPPPGRMLVFEFEVEDSGPGIPESLQARIFEPFVQGDLGLSKKFGGTGLGLSICQQLSSLMRGDISLHSDVGNGSVFTMSIPLRYIMNRADSTSSSIASYSASRHNSIDHGVIGKVFDDEAASIHSLSTTYSNTANGPVPFESDAKPRLVGLRQPFFASNQPLESPGSQQAAMERVTAEATRRPDKVKVLVAEDNKTNQEVVLRMLKLEDIYDVTVAKDGQEAFDLVKESMASHNPFQLIFMDVQMPNLDGLESTRLIRKTGYSAPIVALTAYSEEQNVKECLASGMDYFLSKPIKRPQLKHVLKTYCPTIHEEDDESPSGSTNSGKQPANGTQPKTSPIGVPNLGTASLENSILPTLPAVNNVPDI